jgi:hypothetical protein
VACDACRRRLRPGIAALSLPRSAQDVPSRGPGASCATYQCREEMSDSSDRLDELCAARIVDAAIASCHLG